MRRIICIALVAFYYCACKPKIKVPEGVLPQQKMEEVMTDLMRVDEYISMQGVTDSGGVINSSRIGLYQKVFKMHNVEKPVFQKSLQFYQNHPDLLKIILDSMHSKTSRINSPFLDTTKRVLPKKIDHEQSVQKR